MMGLAHAADQVVSEGTAGIYFDSTTEALQQQGSHADYARGYAVPGNPFCAHGH